MQTVDRPSTTVMDRLRRIPLVVRVSLLLAAAVLVCVLALIIPATDANAVTSATSCGSVAVSSVAAAGDVPEGTLPSDDLAATNHCDHILGNDQSQYEAIIAGLGLVAFGGATLFYRSRRHRGTPARA